MTVPAKEEGYSDPLGYVSGSMEIVNFNFTLPYLGYKGMQIFQVIINISKNKDF